jgi:hypothetical protein
MVGSKHIPAQSLMQRFESQQALPTQQQSVERSISTP